MRNNTAYFVAGRQQLADGGVIIFAIDPVTGKKQWVHRLDQIPQKADPTGNNPFKGFYENPQGAIIIDHYKDYEPIVEGIFRKYKQMVKLWDGSMNYPGKAKI